MSTRQLRLNSREQICKRLDAFTGKKMNIVMNDRPVVLITLQSFDEKVVSGVNMRLKEVRIPIEDISELYFDTRE